MSLGEAWRLGCESLRVTAGLYYACVGIGLFLAFQAVRQTWREARSGQKSALIFFILLAIGLLLRLLWIGYTQPAPISDYLEYWQEATRLAGGDWTFISIDKHPGIILLMTACFKLLGHNPEGVWSLNLLFSGLSLVLIYRIGLLLFKPWTALLAVLLAVMQPQLIAYTGLFASEWPTLFFYLLITWFVLDSRKQDTWNLLQWAALGCAIYAAALTRSTSLLFLGLIPLTLLLFRWRTRWRELVRIAVCMATAGLLLSTWLYHQYLLTGMAQMFWGGEIWLVSTTHYKTEGRLVNPWELPGLSEKLEKSMAGLPMPASRLAALSTMKAWAIPIIQKDPMRYLAEGKTRLRHILWTTSETGIRDTQTGSPALSRWPKKAVRRLAESSKHIWRVTLLLGVLGYLLAWRRRKPSAAEGLTFIGAFLAAWIGFHFLMAVASDRWAVQIIPYTLILAAHGVTELVAAWGLLWPGRRQSLSSQETVA